MRRPFSTLVQFGLFSALPFIVSCADDNGRVTTPTTPTTSATINDDAALFRLITQMEPFSGYQLFPNADEFTEGRLNGSEAHRPLVRVSINARAASVLQNGRLPANTRFPDGSIIFKEIRPQASVATTTYVVMYKDSANALAGNGWLWAEFNPNGVAGFSVKSRGSACTSCHQREQGPRNDSVRTFERQR